MEQVDQYNNTNTKKIIIEKPILEEDEENTILKVNINIDGSKKEAWYKVKKEYGKYFLTQRCDSFLVVSLIYALKNGLDIECELPVSERLYFQLTEQLIPFLCGGNSTFKPIKIKCKLDSKNYNIEDGVGTGISCGVDSLGTISQYSNISSNYKVNMLTLYNSGYYTVGNNIENYNKYIRQSVNFAKEHNYNLLTVDSNISTIFNYNFLEAHAYLTCSITLLLQPMFKIYYYASGYNIVKDFKYDENHTTCAYYDIFLLDCISTEGLKFYSGQSSVRRIEKVKRISKNENFLKYLYVCVAGNPPHNCTKCEKCIRTVLEIDALNMLEKYKDVFDIKLYCKYRLLYIAYALRHKKEIYYDDICYYMKKNHMWSYMLAHLFYLIPSPLDLRKNKTVMKIAKILKGKRS